MMYKTKILVIILVLLVLGIGTLSLAAQMNNNIAFATSSNNSTSSSSGNSTSISSSSFSCSGGTHTADYRFGCKIGQHDARTAGVFDVGDSCNGHVFKNCFAGYSDGYKSICGDTKTHSKPCGK
jgi:hypothetical protein